MVIVSSGLNEICLALVHLFESIPQLFSKPLQRLEFSQENFFLEINSKSSFTWWSGQIWTPQIISHSDFTSCTFLDFANSEDDFEHQRIGDFLHIYCADGSWIDPCDYIPYFLIIFHFAQFKSSEMEWSQDPRHLRILSTNEVLIRIIRELNHSFIFLFLHSGTHCIRQWICSHRRYFEHCFSPYVYFYFLPCPMWQQQVKLPSMLSLSFSLLMSVHKSWNLSAIKSVLTAVASAGSVPPLTLSLSPITPRMLLLSVLPLVLPRMVRKVSWMLLFPLCMMN